MREEILITTSSFGVLDEGPIERLKHAGYSVTLNPFGRKLSAVEVVELLVPEVVGLVAGVEPLGREALEKSSLRVISRVGVGLSNVDLNAASELGIDVRYTPDGPTTAVAELSVGVLLALIREVPRVDRALRAGRWEKRIGMQLEGKTVAVIGYGRIGRKVSELLQAFGARVIVVDPHVELDPGESVEQLQLDDALKQADIVALHSSGEDCILDESTLGFIKPGAYILNAARGGLISEPALIEALTEERVAGAWLDTFSEEPYSGPLREFPNVVLTPHIGSYTAECRVAMETAAVDNLLDALA